MRDKAKSPAIGSHYWNSSGLSTEGPRGCPRGLALNTGYISRRYGVTTRKNCEPVPIRMVAGLVVLTSCQFTPAPWRAGLDCNRPVPVSQETITFRPDTLTVSFGCAT